jgi:hypothetical protein
MECSKREALVSRCVLISLQTDIHTCTIACILYVCFFVLFCSPYSPDHPIFFYLHVLYFTFVHRYTFLQLLSIFLFLINTKELHFCHSKNILSREWNRFFFLLLKLRIRILGVGAWCCWWNFKGLHACKIPRRHQFKMFSTTTLYIFSFFFYLNDAEQLINATSED